MVIVMLVFLLSVWTAEAVRMNADMYDGSYLIKLAEHSYLFSYRDYFSGGRVGSAHYYSRLYSVNDLNVPLDDTIANSFFSFSRSTLYPIIAKPFTLHGNLVLPMIVKDVSLFDPDDADSTSATLQLASIEKIKAAAAVKKKEMFSPLPSGSGLRFAELGYVFKSHKLARLHFGSP
ncbi:hypothetical protein IPH25_00220 [bacterium]|nr:MAG: hypothetical protein IPG37_02335 [bacterium]QQR61859.1 MAG: hypothetical protein IPH25_00220 [bacterium]QQR62561.1 MAG: hypothetical protein IPH67_04030 [bacterium]